LLIRRRKRPRQPVARAAFIVQYFGVRHVALSPFPRSGIHSSSCLCAFAPLRAILKASHTDTKGQLCHRDIFVPPWKKIVLPLDPFHRNVI
jgi:hypothetical protein